MPEEWLCTCESIPSTQLDMQACGAGMFHTPEHPESRHSAEPTLNRAMHENGSLVQALEGHAPCKLSSWLNHRLRDNLWLHEHEEGVTETIKTQMGHLTLSFPPYSCLPSKSPHL